MQVYEVSALPFFVASLFFCLRLVLHTLRAGTEGDYPLLEDLTFATEVFCLCALVWLLIRVLSRIDRVFVTVVVLKERRQGYGVAIR